MTTTQARPAAAPPAAPTTARHRLRLPSFILAAPAWAWLVTFFVAPVGLVLWYSFGRKPGVFDTHSNDVLTLDRYREAFSSTFFTTFTNTLQISIVGTAICLLVGFPFAYWLAVRVPERWRGLLLGLVLVPFWTNFLVRTIGWAIIISPQGIASNLLQDIGLRDTALELMHTRTAVQLGVVYNYLPLMILPIFVSLDRMDPALREASKDLGANRWRTLTQVTLPLARPGIVAGLLLVFIPLMGDYITATVLGGAKGNMVGQLVASQFQAAQNWALGSAMAVLLMLIILATVAAAAVLLWAVGALLRARRGLRIEVPSR